MMKTEAKIAPDNKKLMKNKMISYHINWYEWERGEEMLGCRA